MDPLVLSLLLYLKTNLGIELMDPQHDRPSYTVVTQKEMIAMKGTDALGICIDGKIFIENVVDLSTTTGKAVLLHELVHYTQHYCPLAKDWVQYSWNERVAYAAQNSYLRDKGSTERVHMPNSEGLEYYEDVMYPLRKKGPCGYSCPPAVEPETPEKIRERFKQAEAQ